LLFKYSYNNKIHIKEEIAKHNSCPPHVLLRLFNEAKAIVLNTPVLDIRLSFCFLQCCIIKNKNFPIDSLEELVKNKQDFFILQSVVKNINCPFHILKKVYKENEILKYLIPNHPNWRFNDFI